MDFKKAVSDQTVSFLTDRYPGTAQKWIGDFADNVQILCDRWHFVPDAYESDSRFGAILYGETEKYGRCAVKLIPWFCERLETEIKCYKLLPYREMCPMFDCDTEIGALLLRYMPGEEKTPAMANVFASLNAQRKRADALGPEAGIPLYSDVLKGVAQNALREIEARNDAALLPLKGSITRAMDAMRRFKNHDKFLIHGDIHRHNMIVSGGNICVIDPIGFIAPYAFEYTRYLGTEIKEFGMDKKTAEEALFRMRADETGIRDVTDALGIDTTMRACNTFIEGDTYETICRGVKWAADAWKIGDSIQKQL